LLHWEVVKDVEIFVAGTLGLQNKMCSSANMRRNQPDYIIIALGTRFSTRGVRFEDNELQTSSGF
jgi:hypothetical protein